MLAFESNSLDSDGTNYRFIMFYVTIRDNMMEHWNIPLLVILCGVLAVLNIENLASSQLKLFTINYTLQIIIFAIQ